MLWTFNLQKVDTLPEDTSKNVDQHSYSSLITNSDNENTLDRCYQCMICRPMFFRKKSSLRKRLWRSRVITSTNLNSSRQSQQLCQETPNYFQNYQFLSNETSTECYPQTIQQENLNCQRNCGTAKEEGSSILSTTTSVLRNCCTNSNSTSTIDLYDPTAATTEQQTLRMFRLLMNQLKKESQLETLCQAIEYGLQIDNNKLLPHQYQPTDCVLVPRGSIEGEEPQLIACRLWRWNDLYDCNSIKRIPSCPNSLDPIYVCCNPAHWSRIYHLGNFFISSLLAFDEITRLILKIFHSKMLKKK